MFDRHQTEKTADRTFRIFEEKFVNAYLLMGDEKALWIGTGNGSGNLSEVVQSMTYLPVQAIATHCHADHLGGAGWFDQVLVPQQDLAPVYARSATPLASRIAAKMFGVKHRPVKQPHKPVFVPVSLSWRLDLGGRILEAIPLPGHTAGSIGLLDRENRMLFCREMELVLASQSKNAVIGKVKTSPSGILTYCTSGLYKK